MPELLCQFLRVHAHGATAAHALLAEADRVPSHCSHIERPLPPRWYRGSPEEALRELKSFLGKPQLVRLKSGGVLYRKVRPDQRCFMDCVASYPPDIEYLKQNPSDIEKKKLREWINQTQTFIEKEFGAHYVACCLHLDESHVHFHFYIVGNASRIHPGLRSELVDGRRIKDGKERMRRHREALRAFLDRFYSDVGCKLGHSRGEHRRIARRIPDRQAYKEFKRLLEQRDESRETEGATPPRT